MIVRLTFRRDMVLSLGLMAAAAAVPVLARLFHGQVPHELVQATIADMAGWVPAMNWGSASQAAEASLFSFAVGWQFAGVAMVLVVVPCRGRAARTQKPPPESYRNHSGAKPGVGFLRRRRHALIGRKVCS